MKRAKGIQWVHGSSYKTHTYISRYKYIYTYVNVNKNEYEMKMFVEILE